MTSPGPEPALPPFPTPAQPAPPAYAYAPPPFGAPAFGAPPPAAPQPSSPAGPTEHNEHGEPGGFDRLSLVIAILLAMIGVLGAFVTWRIGQLSNAAEDASRSALAARREHSAAGVESSTRVQQAWADWLGYEVAHRKAEALRAAGEYSEAVRYDREASAFWGGVPAADLKLDGSYDQAAHLDALTAASTDGLDVFAQPHLDDAATAEFQAIRIGQIGFAVAGILPLLTLAEITRRRRLSVALVLVSALGLVGGTALLVTAWT